ncbi:outer membrane beta-barrel protein [Hymenobacter terricola]|uniref:outer membrane beta-barrel protein n=1 Tax=Hymenobacter terricola TaxID=2819236 RepID=UPI001B31659D|nr:outer membrane beta-barrel protein [Hymenobacter terricola]
MATFSRVWSGALLLGALSFGARAQEAAGAGPAPGYRWYVGGLAAFQTFATTSVFTAQEGTIGPLYGYLGYQITPHLAVQGGYMQRSQSHADSFSGINNAGQPFTYAQTDTYFNAAVPLLLRFRLARQPAHRLHLDALLGATVLLHHYHYENNNTVTGQPTTQTELDLRAKNGYITGGLSVGFTLTPHLELTAEATNNWYLNARDYYHWQVQPGAGIGLRYHFNARRAG